MSETLDANQIIVTHDDATDTYSFTDATLEEIGERMKAAVRAYREAKKTIRALEAEQQRRIDAVSKMDHLYHYPTRQQATMLNTFKLALGQENASMLRMAHTLCTQTDADKTNWRTDDGETVEVAFARRLAELERSE